MNLLLKILICCLIVEQTMSYYFYNVKNNQVISSSYLNVPKGFRIIQPPKTLKFDKDRFTKGLYCQDIGFTCTERFNYSSTYQFECENDSNCPTTFICCPQKCFTHKICTKGTVEKRTKNVSAKSIRNERTLKHDNGMCEKWPYPCPTPYSIHVTYKFKCDYDGQCPNQFKCCQQDCFAHKICSKISKYVEELSIRHNHNSAESKIESQLQTRTPEVVSDIETSTHLIETSTDETTKFVEVVTELAVTMDTTELSETTEELDESTSDELDESNTTDDLYEPNTGSTDNNVVQTMDPNAIDPQYRDYYEEGNEDES